MKYLYRIAFQGRRDKLGVHTFRFIPAYSVHEVLIIAGYEYKIGVAYGVPVLEVKIDKDIKDGVDYLPEYQTTEYERTSYDQ